jgi:L,D-transpeptidase YbiS
VVQQVRLGLLARITSLVVRLVICLAGVVLLVAGVAVGGVAVVYYWWPAVDDLVGEVRGDLAWRRLDPKIQAQRLAAKERQVASLRAESQGLRESAGQRLPEGPYIVVHKSTNTLFLRTADTVMRQAVCSTGSGKILTTPNGRRTWEFHTPSGVHKVLSKHHFPVWYKPDWAFIEEGEKVPPANSPERMEEAVLGEYSLNFGNGYMIHGTIYPLQLGMAVTHGCVRLGDDDLAYVFENAPVGTKIFIF